MALAGSVGLTQVGRGGSRWLTALGDAQRTSWVRVDDKISPETMAAAGFGLQWSRKLDNPARGPHGLTQGVTASGVTLFVPMSLVAGSSNRVFALDNDLGYLVWERRFDVTMPAPTVACPGGIASAATRIVPVDGTATTAAGNPFGGGGRGAVGYRTLLGEPGEGVPTEGRGGPARRNDPAPPPGAPAAPGAAQAPGAPAAPAARGAGPAPQAPGGGGRANQVVERIPGSPRPAAGAPPVGGLGRPSGVGYVVTSDGMLHVLGLASGKDLQKPAPFLPANAKWSAPIGVDTRLYAATSGGCGGAPHAVWAIDLDSDAKPVVSWKTDGGPVVGAVAFTSGGTLIAAVGAGQVTGDGKANAIVALDPATLAVKDWFTHPTAEFVTGPTILRQGEKDVVVAATKDGRVLVLDAASLGGADHATPLAASTRLLGDGGRVSADALAAWQQINRPAPGPAGAAPAPAPAPVAPAPVTVAASWILLPVAGRLGAGLPAANGPVSSGAVIALKLVDAGGKLALEPGWVSHDHAAPGTPIIVNGVVFSLATGLPAGTGRGAPAVLHAYNGATGARLWTSGTSMTSQASPSSFWTGLGQIYVGATDGTLYTFGFNDERRHTAGQ
ncbi:MAG: hypothetical protein ABI211_18890 [Vicinamibacterales bacterium]